MIEPLFSCGINDNVHQNIINRLDESQREVVLCDDPRILVSAPAGSGKTSCLTAAVCHYCYNNLNDKVCAITFTNAATDELSQKLRDSGIDNVEVETIHRWARNRLRELSEKYHFEIRVLLEDQIKLILQEIIAEYTREHPRKTYNINLSILYTFVMNAGNIDLSGYWRSLYEGLTKRYLDYKRTNHLYDYLDYPLYLHDVLIHYNEHITNIDALFVDEFQDVDPTQIIDFELTDAKKKFYIGDPKQSIYIFRGADGEAFNKCHDFTKFTLGYNYRSYQEIIDYATTVYDALRDRSDFTTSAKYITKITFIEPSITVCKRGRGAQLYTIDPYGRIHNFGSNTTAINNTQTLLHKFLQSQSKILCRTNKQVQSVLELGYESVDTIHQAKGLEYQSVILLDADIKSLEDLNVAYVGMTRAKDSLLIVNSTQFLPLFKEQVQKFDSDLFI